MMMDKKSLLEDGFLEQYLLGELNANQCHQIEQLLASDAELKLYFDTLEEDFERIGLENTIAPPAVVKSQLLEEIKGSKSKEIDLVSTRQNNSAKFHFGIAATIATLLAVSLFWMYTKLDDVTQQLQAVESNNSSLNKTIDTLNTKLEDTTTFYATITNPDTKQYILEGNAALPEAKMVSYVNHKSKTVIVNSERLPQLDADHDYQMWADVDGEMIDMGVI
jgi:anti-sigma-K factor RskA